LNLPCPYLNYECKLFSEAEEVLKKISDMGISQSILSASKEDVLIKSLPSWELRLSLSAS
jgi:hypothetical protein